MVMPAMRRASRFCYSRSSATVARCLANRSDSSSAMERLRIFAATMVGVHLRGHVRAADGGAEVLVGVAGRGKWLWRGSARSSLGSAAVSCLRHSLLSKTIRAAHEL